MRYSENYVFTAKATSADDLQKIKTLRQTVKAINRMQSQYEKTPVKSRLGIGYVFAVVLVRTIQMLGSTKCVRKIIPDMVPGLIR